MSMIDIRARHAHTDSKPCMTTGQWPCDTSQVLTRLDVLENALKAIIACDYRGNEPPEHGIARVALGGPEPESEPIWADDDDHVEPPTESLWADLPESRWNG